MNWLTGLSLKSYLYAGIAIIIVGLGLGLKVQTSRLNAVKTEYATFKANVEAAQKVHEAEDTRKAAESDKLIGAKDAELKTAVNATAASWKSYADGLRLKANRSSADQGQKPASPIVVQQCNEAAGNEAVSTAISKYRSDVDAAVTGFRIGIASILSACDQNTAQLINLQDAVSGLAAVNTP